MYRFSQGELERLKIRGISTKILSATEFRQDMFILHRQLAAQPADEHNLVIVRNMKEGFDMFLVTPIEPFADLEAHEFIQQVKAEVKRARA